MTKEVTSQEDTTADLGFETKLWEAADELNPSTNHHEIRGFNGK